MVYNLSLVWRFNSSNKAIKASCYKHQSICAFLFSNSWKCIMIMIRWTWLLLSRFYLNHKRCRYWKRYTYRYRVREGFFNFMLLFGGYVFLKLIKYRFKSIHTTSYHHPRHEAWSCFDYHMMCFGNRLLASKKQFIVVFFVSNVSLPSVCANWGFTIDK